MEEYTEGQIEFALLALVRDPILEHRENLAVNIKSLQTVHSRLDVVNPDWKVFANDESEDDPILIGPTEKHHVSDEAIKEATIPESTEKKLKAECQAMLMELHLDLITSQRALLRSISDEEVANFDDARKAKQRREDYSPLIHRWLSMLAEKEGLIKDLIEDSR